MFWALVAIADGSRWGCRDARGLCWAEALKGVVTLMLCSLFSGVSGLLTTLPLSLLHMFGDFAISSILILYNYITKPVIFVSLC